jgi:ABC-2 type transport system permease protein
MSVTNSPSSIADLSYRNYDGPLNPPGSAWKHIARTMTLKAFRMKSLWIVSVLSSWYFLVLGVILFFLQTFGASSPTGTQAFQSFVDRLVWKDEFLHGFGFGQHLFLVVALIVGAGSIANDNRANSLLVYLSKPSRKIDYLIGKWLGVFIPILVVMAIPSLFFYVYGIFSFREEGFFSSDHWLILRVICLLPLAAAIHASLIIAVSSLFKQGAVAGAVYGGIYFMSYFFTVVMQAVWIFGRGKASTAVIDLNYASIDGLQIGLAKAILRAGATRPFGLPERFSPVPAPALMPFLVIVAILIGGSIWFSWTRIRAVEVV